MKLTTLREIVNPHTFININGMIVATKMSHTVQNIIVIDVF